MKRIVIITKSGFVLYGDFYEVDIHSPIIFDYSPHNTGQDYLEFEKAMLKYRVNFNGVERWYVEERKS